MRERGSFKPRAEGRKELSQSLVHASIRSHGREIEQRPARSPLAISSCKILSRLSPSFVPSHVVHVVVGVRAVRERGHQGFVRSVGMPDKREEGGERRRLNFYYESTT